jgi:2-dehydropantoate 2-reductase
MIDSFFTPRLYMKSGYLTTCCGGVMTGDLMKTAIIGPGAMGSMLAANLVKGGMDVTLMDYRPERAVGLQDSGIQVQGVRGDYHVRVPVTTEAKLVGPVDLVIMCVKAYQSEAAMRQNQTLVGDGTTVWSVQNGLGNTEAMARVVRIDQIVGGSTTMGANLIETGVVFHAGEGDTFIGELAESTQLTGTGSSPRVEALAKALSDAGITVQVRTDMQRVIWRKLIINAGINAITAILQVPNGALLEYEPARILMDAAVGEAVKVAGTRGIHFDPFELQTQVKDVAARTAQNHSSMLQDMRAGRRTEIDYINGAIARRGSAPVNASLTSLVLALEALGPSRQQLRPLV